MKSLPIPSNSIGTIGGMVCDGAKSSCAAKIASAVMTALLAYEMAKHGNVIREGEGIVSGRSRRNNPKCWENGARRYARD